MKELRFDVFGNQVLIVETRDGWEAWYPGNDGKRRRARDIIVPHDMDEQGMCQYLGDLCHEWASDRNSSVRRCD